jgi:hypothetical protein
MLVRLRLAALAAALVATPALLRGTVIVPAEFREIVAGSEIIAFGRVADAVAEASPDRKRIDTLVTFDVGTYLKGAGAGSIVVRVPGGQVGRYRDLLVGAPVFTPGDEAILFLTVRDGQPYIFGLNQGVFRVRFDPDLRRRIVVPPALRARSETPETVVRGAAARRSVPLETFGAHVRAVLAEQQDGAVR